MADKLVPYRRAVVVRRVQVSETRGGIIIPGQADEWRYYVHSVGPRVKDLNIGDELLLRKGADAWGWTEDPELMLITPADILSLIVREPDAPVDPEPAG